jgi:hypothetical protein
MIRSCLRTGTALLLVLSGCSSDDDESSPAQTTMTNQPGGGNAAGASNVSQPNNSNANAPGSATSTGSGNAGAGNMEGTNMNIDRANTGGASTAGGGMTPGIAMGSGGMGMAPGDDTSMSFFVTSVGSGTNGGNLGGLDGADATCEQLAAAVGAGDKTWRAYLSTDTVNARERIGAGPWHNQAGTLIAESVADLHAADTVFNGAPNRILDENGQNAPGAQHDVLTGSNADGTTAAGLNCANWTSNAATLTENPRVGHSDIPANTMFSPSWNAAHASANCSQAGLTMRGGAGRLYCFAAG